MWRLYSHRRAGEARSLKRRSISATILFVALVVFLSASFGAYAVPLSEKREEALRIKSQIDELDEKVEIAAEDYNEAKAAYDSVTVKVRKTEARMAALTARQDELEGALSTRVSGMYRQGPLGALELLLGSTTFEEFATTWDLLQDMNSNDAARVAELKQTRAELNAAREELKAAQATAKAEFDTMKARKAAIEKQLAERKRLLSGVEAEIAAIRREQEAAASRRAVSSSSRVDFDYGNPTNAPHSDVVRVALTKLGAPYRWAAAGPNAFDCSGFTMWCYAQVGVSLPHSSRAQINCGQRVSRSNLQPGDLVFFGLSGIHHVGIYVGGGNYIHAPNTGDVVRIQSLASSGSYAGACRP